MKRREFNLMTACSAAALGAGLGAPKRATAAVAAEQAALLKTTLTPFGAERAGNADGSIPAWTGGLTQVPAGWTPDQPMPDLFANEKPILRIDSSNMEQYKDRLSEGVMLMMQKYGYYINVYPTHRTAAAPQWVYDNIYQNALNAQPAAGGTRLGFTGAYGGAPFPIPNQEDPYRAGGEIIWNHLVCWDGPHTKWDHCYYVMENGTLTLTTENRVWRYYNYYVQNENASTYGSYSCTQYQIGLAPAANQGAELVVWLPTNPLVTPEQGWEYLPGQGRVRRSPEIQYDIPEAEVDGITNYDESLMFYGSPDRFDWKLIGKKEMYVPYNCNKVVFMTREDCLPHFVNPEIIRWELHRVWEVEATLHPGARDVVPHRRIYFDEDTWIGVLGDEYDAQGNYWVQNNLFVINRPDVPGTCQYSFLQCNLQSRSYALQEGHSVDAATSARVIDYVTAPDVNLFNPQTMAARAQF
jgi:hypothetical protein